MSVASRLLGSFAEVDCPFLAEIFDNLNDEKENEQENIGSVEPVYQDLDESTNADDNPIQVDIANSSLVDRQEIMPPRPKEEPEPIRLWREQQGKLLEEKDAKEVEMMAKMKAEAEQELKDWYKRYEEDLDKTKKNTREDGKEFV